MTRKRETWATVVERLFNVITDGRPFVISPIQGLPEGVEEQSEVNVMAVYGRQFMPVETLPVNCLYDEFVVHVCGFVKRINARRRGTIRVEIEANGTYVYERHQARQRVAA